jgi:WD40 repeat protein
VVALAVAPDGSWLASAGYDGEVRIWDPTGGVARHTLTGHSNEVEALAVAPDGSWLASAGDGRKMWILDPTAGTTLLTGHDGEIRIWEPTTGAALTSMRVAGRLFHLLLASTTIAAAGQHGPYFLTLCPGIQSK